MLIVAIKSVTAPLIGAKKVFESEPPKKQRLIRRLERQKLLIAAIRKLAVAEDEVVY